jgi:hypothetical protein
MKRYPDIDYSYRPSSYWEDETPAQAILKNIKGDFRREEIRKALAQGKLDEIPQEILRDAISDKLRKATGRIHPRFMGGEYLPDYRAGEVEIARISLASTTNDIISLRARRGRTGVIRYSIADEYNGDFTYSLSRQTSKRPLTLGQLVCFLENSCQHEVPGDLILGYNELNNEHLQDRDSLRHFTRISSEFYPQLARHCEHVFEDWVDAGLEAEQEDEDDILEEEETC